MHVGRIHTHNDLSQAKKTNKCRGISQLRELYTAMGGGGGDGKSRRISRGAGSKQLCCVREVTLRLSSGGYIRPEPAPCTVCNRTPWQGCLDPIGSDPSPEAPLGLEQEGDRARDQSREEALL